MQFLQYRIYTPAERQLISYSLELSLLKLEALLLKANFDPNQPRVPKGNSDGGNWTDSSGFGGGSAYRELRRQRRYAQNRTSSRYQADLRAHELRGGHTVLRHVGKSDAYLLQRMQTENIRTLFGTQFIGRAGTFTSLAAANRLVSSTLTRNSAVVDAVAAGIKQSAFVTARFGSITGKEYYRKRGTSGPIRLRNTYGVGVYIIHDVNSPLGYRIRTAYPREDL